MWNIHHELNNGSCLIGTTPVFLNVVTICREGKPCVVIFLTGDCRWFFDPNMSICIYCQIMIRWCFPSEHGGSLLNMVVPFCLHVVPCLRGGFSITHNPWKSRLSNRNIIYVLMHGNVYVRHSLARFDYQGKTKLSNCFCSTTKLCCFTRAHLGCPEKKNRPWS